MLTTIDSVCDYGYSENVNVDEIALSEWILELEDIEKIVGALLLRGLRKIEQSMEFDIDSSRAMFYTQNSEPISTKYW